MLRRFHGSSIVAVSIAILGLAPAFGQQRDPRVTRDLPQAVPEPSRDILILRSGGSEQGKLTGCSAQSCSMDGKSHRRDDILFIGIGIGSTDLPPTVEEPTQDLIQLRNAPALQAKLVGINQATVLSAQGSNPRQAVAWVYLAPPPPKPPAYSERPIAPGAPAPPPGTSNTPPQPPQPETDKSNVPRETRQPPPPAGGGPPKQGALWTGTVHWTAKHTPTHHVTSRATVKLRETQVSDRSIELVHEGSTVTVTHSTVGADYCTHAGGGTSPAEGRAGWVVREQSTGPKGEPRWGPWTYELTITPAREPIWTQTCPDVAWPGTNRTHTVTYGGNASGSWLAFIGGLNDTDPGTPRLLDGGRMTGSYTSQRKQSWEDKVSWSICRAGETCPPLDAGSPNACPAPRNERALLDLALDQQRALTNRLAAKFDEYFRLANEARQHKAAFDHATTHCRLWAGARWWASFVLSSFAPTSTRVYGKTPVPPASGAGPPAQYTAEAGKEFANFLSFVEKLLDNDDSWMLPNSEFKQWFSAEDAYDAFKTAYDGVRPSSYAEQVDALRSCGAPTMQVQMDRAIRYLRLMEQVAPLMQEVSTLLNDLRKKDEQISDLWNKYYAACLEHAKCKGLPPSVCQGLPASR